MDKKYWEREFTIPKNTDIIPCVGSDLLNAKIKEMYKDWTLKKGVMYKIKAQWSIKMDGL